VSIDHDNSGPEIVDVAIAAAGEDVVRSLKHELVGVLRRTSPEAMNARLGEMFDEYGDALLAAVALLPVRGLDEERRAEGLRLLMKRCEPTALAAWAFVDALRGFEWSEQRDARRVFDEYVARFGDQAIEPLLHYLQRRGEDPPTAIVEWLAGHAPQRLRIWAVRLFDRTADEAALAPVALRALGPEGRDALIDFVGASRAEIRLRAIAALMEDPGPDLLDVFAAQCERDRSGRVRDALQRAMFRLRQEGATPIRQLSPTREHHAELDARMAAHPLRLPKKLQPEPLPRLRWTSGVELSEGAQHWVLGRLGSREQDDDLLDLRPHLDRESRRALLHALREQFDPEESDEGRIGWVLYAAAALGSDDDMTDFGRGLDRLARSGAWAEANHRLEVMRRHGGAVAIQWIDRWARTAQSRTLREHAVQALQRMAERAGLSADELTERAMDDFGFDSRGRQQLEWGTRGGMTIALGASNELSLIDENGKIWTRYPGVLKADDPDEIARVKAAVSNLKKQVKLATRGQVARMERAMIAGRSWDAESFRTYLRNPLIANLARQLLWGLFEDGRFLHGFRVAQDRSFADVQDDVVEIGGRQVRLVHPLHLDENARRRWGALFVDYELIPVFEQLDRPVFEPTSEERASSSVRRFARTPIGPDRLRYHFERRNWIRGPAQDGGLVHWVTRPFRSHDLTAIAYVEPGFSVIRGGWENPQEVDRIEFLQGVRRSPTWRGDERLVIDDVDPIVFSEVVYDVHLLESSG
jgi:hypothetical protein